MGDFNLPVAHVRDFLYAHAAKETVLSFGPTCHTHTSSTDIDMCIVSPSALPLITQFWKGNSVLKTHDPLRLKLQTRMK
jgi:hypothetical protein